MQFLLMNESSISKFSEMLKEMMINNGGSLELDVTFLDYDEEDALDVISASNGTEEEQEVTLVDSDQEPIEIKSKKLDIEEDEDPFEDEENDLDSLTEDEIRGTSERLNPFMPKSKLNIYVEDDESDEEAYYDEEEDSEDVGLTASSISTTNSKTLTIEKDESGIIVPNEVKLSFEEYRDLLKLVEDVQEIKERLEDVDEIKERLDEMNL